MCQPLAVPEASVRQAALGQHWAACGVRHMQTHEVPTTNGFVNFLLCPRVLVVSFKVFMCRFVMFSLRVWKMVV